MPVAPGPRLIKGAGGLSLVAYYLLMYSYEMSRAVYQPMASATCRVLEVTLSQLWYDH